MNNLSLVAALATAPTSAFTELRERPRFWFPMLAVMLATAALMVWYYGVVDIDWLKEQLFANNADFQKLPAEQRAGAMNFVGRNTLMISGVVGAIMAFPFLYLVTALYFLLASKITKMSFGLKHWFSFVCWVSLPGLLSIVAAVVTLLLRDNDQIGPGVLQPLSLNQLVFHRPVGVPGQAYLDAVNIPALLSALLTVIGVHTWSQRSWGFSAIVGLLPTALIYGIWALFAFR